MNQLICVLIALIICVNCSSDPDCEYGIQSGNICCKQSCGTCGGSGCGQLLGGNDNCCGASIIAANKSCDVHKAPCVIQPPSTPSPTSPPTSSPTPAPTPSPPDPICGNGIHSDQICCSLSCGTCGGSGCGLLPGGNENCCGSSIITANKSCDQVGAPCVISPSPTPASTLSPTSPPMPAPTPSPADPLCENGILDNKICCMLSCGVCGGTGCGQLPGGGENCCVGAIFQDNMSCHNVGAPCNIKPKVVLQRESLFLEHSVQEDFVPIIGYHEIVDMNETLSISEITVNNYEEQIEALVNEVHCNFITMEKLSSYIVDKQKLPTNACVITFDDGTLDQYETGLCILNKYQIPGTFYIVTNRSYSDYMNFTHMDKLSDMLHDISSHSVSHPYLSEQNFTEQQSELYDSYDTLVSKNFSSVTFAYPFGDWNDDTITILKNSSYELSRDTQKDNQWREKRTITISYDEDFLWHFHYIKGENRNSSQLVDDVQYTGWWQFEENYKIMRDDDDDIKLLSSSLLHPTNTSFAVIKLPDFTDQISTQFITKYLANFSIEILASNPFDVKIDNQTCDLYVGSQMYNSNYNTVYYTYNVNLELSPGVHDLHITNVYYQRIFLDKFRMYSDVNQDFVETSPYNCNASQDDNYCSCS